MFLLYQFPSCTEISQSGRLWDPQWEALEFRGTDLGSNLPSKLCLCESLTHEISSHRVSVYITLSELQGCPKGLGGECTMYQGLSSKQLCLHAVQCSLQL